MPATPLFTALLSCALMLGASRAAVGADPALLDMERMRVQREQRMDEMRLRMDQDQRARLLEDSRRALELQPDGGRLTTLRPSEDAQRSIRQQLDAQERLSQQLLHQNQLSRERRLRQSIIAEPDAIARGRLYSERLRAMREHDAHRLRFQSLAR